MCYVSKLHRVIELKYFAMVNVFSFSNQGHFLFIGLKYEEAYDTQRNSIDITLFRLSMMNEN